jgi:hypothetical protein
VQAVWDERNARPAAIDWQFTARRARVNLKKYHLVVNTQQD